MRCRFSIRVADDEHKKLTPGHKKMPLGLKKVTPLQKYLTPGHKKVLRGGRFDSQFELHF